MNHEDVVKMGLTGSTPCDEVQSLGEKVIAYWAEVRTSHQDELRRRRPSPTLVQSCQRGRWTLTKASVLPVSVQLFGGPQAVQCRSNALKALSGGYAKLLQMQKALGELMGDSE